MKGKSKPSSIQVEVWTTLDFVVVPRVLRRKNRGKFADASLPAVVLPVGRFKVGGEDDIIWGRPRFFKR